MQKPKKISLPFFLPKQNEIFCFKRQVRSGFIAIQYNECHFVCIENATDVLTKCHIWLVTIKLFPDLAKTLGVCMYVCNGVSKGYLFFLSLYQLDLYDVLSQQPAGAYSTVADNPYRELLGKKKALQGVKNYT